MHLNENFPVCVSFCYFIQLPTRARPGMAWSMVYGMSMAVSLLLRLARLACELARLLWLTGACHICLCLGLGQIMFDYKRHAKFSDKAPSTSILIKGQATKERAWHGQVEWARLGQVRTLLIEASSYHRRRIKAKNLAALPGHFGQHF